MRPVLPSAVDIAIIGGGAAGLAAARALQNRPVTVALLEARSRIGGRAYTFDWRGHGVDAGCGWLHSADDNVLAPQVQAQGLTLDKTPPPWESQAFDLEVSAAEQAEFGQAFAAFEQRVAEAAGRGEDRPAADLFDPACRWNGRMDAISGALNGARFGQVSTIDYDAYGDTGVNWRVAEGYGRLIAELGRPVPVVLDCPVRRVDRSDGAALALETELGTLRARAVILTVPTSLLSAGDLRIEPADGALLSACEGVPLGLAAKLHMAVEGSQDFPPDSQLWGRTDTADTGGYHLRPFGRPMIEGYFGGQLAWGLESEGPGAFFAFALEELVSLLGSDVRRRVALIHATAWGADPFSRGAYSHALPGRAADRAALARPIEDRIFLAGEHTAPAYYGTAHGAWMEGERAARQALAAVGAP